LKHTLTIRNEDGQSLADCVLSAAPKEGAAYLLCGQSLTEGETRLLVREIAPVAEEDYLAREPWRLSIGSRSYAAVAKHAAQTRSSVLFVHSHQAGPDHHSAQDDLEEPALMRFLADRVPDVPHGSLVVGPGQSMAARVWQQERWHLVQRVRFVGGALRIRDDAPEPAASPMPEFFDRQVRAFGPDVQRLLRSLHVGVVGAGGTGSAVAELLTRLGVGTLSIFDEDLLEPTNVTRVFGSRVDLAGQPKAEVLGRHLLAIGLGTDIRIHAAHITRRETALALRGCDVLFGCTDKQRPRAILTKLALYYLIPVFDTGVRIDAPAKRIDGIHGRLTILEPGQACLFCRGRITAEAVGLESRAVGEREALAIEGYAPHLDTEDPAVVTFTTAVAARAVTEMLHRLTGFMGDTFPSEFRMLFHDDRTRGQAPQAPSDNCFCGQRELWGRGDRRDFLDLAWSS
jgi:hypothetical protein